MLLERNMVLCHLVCCLVSLNRGRGFIAGSFRKNFILGWRLVIIGLRPSISGRSFSNRTWLLLKTWRASESQSSSGRACESVKGFPGIWMIVDLNLGPSATARSVISCRPSGQTGSCSDRGSICLLPPNAFRPHCLTYNNILARLCMYKKALC